MNRTKACFIVVLTAFSCLLSSAQVSTLINYQGRLINGTNLYNGPASIVFRVHDSPTGSGVIWYEDSNNVAIVDGLYAVVIGDDTTGSGDMSWTRVSGAFYIAR